MTVDQPAADDFRQCAFELQVLGRTLDHLGRQTYKRRDVAITELVANCWDAGATRVDITVPSPEDYDPGQSTYAIEDNGSGMSESGVQDKFLVVGRNRREENDYTPEDAPAERPVMGRKGIGKLAGFGVGRRMEIATWTDGWLTQFVLDADHLRAKDGTSQAKQIPGSVERIHDSELGVSGTRIVISGLKHKTPMSIDVLHEALGRRFSRRVAGEMQIFINHEALRMPEVRMESYFPDPENFATEEIADGQTVRYRYAFSEKPITSTDLRGFTILVHEKTAQAPPFYFNVEGTASGQHATKYLQGEIHADFLDEGIDEESDIVSTDRQDIDWEHERAQALHTWGATLTRRILREWTQSRGDRFIVEVKEDPEFSARLASLDPVTRKLVERQIRSLGQLEADPERAHQLADVLIRAYEYQHFHDVVAEIDVASAEPEQLQVLLGHLYDWKALESRAILEIVNGRISIVDKFKSMIDNDASEIAGAPGSDNMHDLIAAYPWLINPEWQILSEETGVTKQLREWGEQDVDPSDRSRYDFLGLQGDGGRLVVIEIKRSGHAVEFDELTRLNSYREKLARSHADIYMMMIGSSFAISDNEKRAWSVREDGEIAQWSDLHHRVRRFYEHFRALLEGDLTNLNFDQKRKEVVLTRQVLERGSYRGQEGRKLGLGPQDVVFNSDLPEVVDKNA